MSIFPSHRGTRRAIYVIAAAVVGFGLWLGYTYLAQPASRVQSQHFQDNGYFYRMRAAFEVKETGERLDFDYVVACNIRVTRWRDGGLSDDSTYSPRMVAKATAGGQAVVLRTLGACNGLTSENGDIPSDILPLAVWFDTVDDLSRGLGYVSEDAYDSPISKLRFHGARIDRATRGEWERWRKQAAESYIEQGVLPGPWGYDYPESDPNIDRYVSSCQGYSRLKLPENLREKLRSLWPAERPRFWALHSENDNKILALISDPTQPSPPGVGPWRVRFGTPNNTIASGLPTRSGSTVGRAPHIPSRWPTENYP
ncbi:MAG TPA: hypothetical protein VFO36_06180, partial [Nitrospiraceae bacterium]|nr:hypothetical protein [Nitrospiraceae bacterium]